VGAHEGLLHFFCGCVDWDVAGRTTLLKDFHVVDCRIAVECVLVAVEGFREFVEVCIERIEPARASEAVPVALGDDVSAGTIP
jgi:hypothetical protein